MRTFQVTNRIDNLRQALLLFLMASFVFCSSVDGQEGSSPESHSSEYVSTTNHAKEPSRKSIQKISDKIDALVKQKTAYEISLGLVGSEMCIETVSTVSNMIDRM